MVEKDQKAVTKRPAGLPPEHKRGPNNRTAQSLRERFRVFLNDDLDRIQRRIKWLSENATDEHRQQVKLMCKLLDKLSPDQRSDVEGNAQGGARIVIQNVSGRLEQAKVVDLEAEKVD